MRVPRCDAPKSMGAPSTAMGIDWSDLTGPIVTNLLPPLPGAPKPKFVAFWGGLRCELQIRKKH